MNNAANLCAFAVIALSLSACAGEEAAAPVYDVRVFLDPALPVPLKSARARLTVAQIGGAPVADATVVVSGSGAAGQSNKLTVPAGPVPGEYSAAGLIFPAEGSYTFTVAIQSPAGSETLTMNVDVGCAVEGGLGASCCAEDACAAGLMCVYGACQGALHAAQGDCHDGGDCLSGVCAAELCAAPACDDGVLNGDEAAADCGGSCATKCDGGVPCSSASDCKHGGCWDGLCALAPGELIGRDGGSAAKFTTILSGQMSAPSDLAFSSSNAKELWVVSPPTDSITVITQPGTPEAVVKVIKDKSDHFLEHVMGISFSDNNSFGTCGDSRNDYNKQAAPNNFMGPVLWPGNLDAYDGLSSAHQAHGDMLHSSPRCMGIASAGNNTYFVFNGYHSVIDWYDFGVPHVPGGTDHSDGVKRRYVDVQLKRVAGVPSNMQYDYFSHRLYVADTGNGRVLRVDPSTANKGKQLQSFLDDGIMHACSGASVEQLSPPPGGLQSPSGLALFGKSLYIGDTATGKIHAWNIDDVGSTSGGTFGTYLKSLDTGLSAQAMGGMTVGPDRRIYLLDRSGARVLRIDP